MSGLTYVHIILGLVVIGVGFTVFRKIWNTIADIQMAGFKLPKI